MTVIEYAIAQARAREEYEERGEPLPPLPADYQPLSIQGTIDRAAGVGDLSADRRNRHKINTRGPYRRRPLHCQGCGTSVPDEHQIRVSE